jgi:chloramphenicol O-acetyltransferase
LYVLEAKVTVKRDAQQFFHILLSARLGVIEGIREFQFAHADGDPILFTGAVFNAL